LIVTDQGGFRFPSGAGRAHPRPWLARHVARAASRRPPIGQRSNLRPIGM